MRIKIMFKKTAACFLALINFTLFPQKADTSLLPFRQAEETLRQLQKPAFFSRKETERVAANKEFIAVWDRIVGNPDIMLYPFDSLKEISVIHPEDNKFRLITWNLQRDDGTHAYFGYLLVNNVKRVKTGFLKHETIQTYESFKLIDRSAAVKYPESYIGNPDKWYGMLYYGLVECDGFYTLLGYDLNDNLTRKKIVDVLYFRPNGTPVFGKDVFRFARKNPKRLVFEYSSEVSMSLKYIEKRKQIVYSHLAPKDEGEILIGQYQYYGPDGSFDAL
jgi:hypothetical protein